MFVRLTVKVEVRVYTCVFRLSSANRVDEDPRNCNSELHLKFRAVHPVVVVGQGELYPD